MSHFTTVKTVIRDREQLCEALRHLHHEFRVGENLAVRGYQGNTERAEVVVTTGCAYDIGFRRESDQAYGAVADWDWGVRREAAPQFQRDAFLQQVNQAYARCALVQQAREHGYVVEEERVLAGGEIELVVSEAV
jgi:hypothetical protein